jgi:hypothetical protein
MAKKFEDITITGMDDAASHKPDHSSVLYNIVLNLSRVAPYEWIDYFNGRWQQHIYMKKRDANVSRDKLTIYCIPEELQLDHLPELKKIIKETNKSYSQYLASQSIEAQRKKQEKNAEKLALNSLKKNLKF